MTKYGIFIDTSYRMILCSPEGCVLRPATKEEEEKYKPAFLGYYIELSDEEFKRGTTEIKERYPDW